LHHRAVDHVIADMAERQHGVVTRRALLRAGVGRHAIDNRLANGRLNPLYRGVYAVGHRILAPNGVRMAAVLAGGRGAVLSHRSAAAIWGLQRSMALELTLPRGRRPLARLRVYRLPIRSDEITRVEAIPVTTVPRTLFDLAAVLPRHQVEKAVNEAQVQRRLDPLSLRDLVDRYPRRRGASTIKAILSGLGTGLAVTRSELEALFLAFLRDRGFPRPEVNASLFVAGRWVECDFVWKDRRVIVELDGWAAHGTATAFERDRARDRMLSAHGWRLVRITWRHLHEERDAVASDLVRILGGQLSRSSTSAA
jgi:very-short-patch-repair endonuclease